MNKVKNFTPQDYIYKDILEMMLSDNEDIKLQEGVVLLIDNAKDIYNDPEDYLDGKYVEDAVYDATYEYRNMGLECNLPPKHYSRHYEVDFVVAEIADKWVGWHYWYGGGKHGEPESIDWIEDAEFVDIESEEEVTVMKRVFKREVV